MASVIMNRFKRNVMAGAIALSATDIICSLVTSAMTDTLTNDEIRDSNTWSSLSAYEVGGTGYTAGGQGLAGLVMTQDDTNNWAKFTADTVTWTDTVLNNVMGAILRTSADAGDGTQSDLICYTEFDSVQSSNNGDFVITWSTNGIIRGR